MFPLAMGISLLTRSTKSLRIFKILDISITLISRLTLTKN